MKTVLVGHRGYWGKILLRNLEANPNIEVIGLVDKKVNGRRSQMEYADLDMALDFLKPEAVVIATPPEDHFQTAIKAINAGCHVLLEKPATTSLEQAELLQSLAYNKGVKVGVDHTFLFSDHVRQVKQVMQSGKLGKVLKIVCTRNNLGKFQESGVIWDLAPHDLAMISYLLDTSNGEVDHVEICNSIGPVDDSADIFMTFDDVKYHLSVSWLHPKKERVLTVVGTEGMIVYDMLAEKPLTIYDKRVFKREDNWVHSFDWMSSYEVKQREPIALLVEEFRQWAAGESEEFVSTLDMGAWVVDTIERIKCDYT